MVRIGRPDYVHYCCGGRGKRHLYGCQGPGEVDTTEQVSGDLVITPKPADDEIITFDYVTLDFT